MNCSDVIDCYILHDSLSSLFFHPSQVVSRSAVNLSFLLSFSVWYTKSQTNINTNIQQTYFPSPSSDSFSCMYFMETFSLYSLNFPTFFLMFSSLYLFAYFVVFRNWGPKDRAEASSCFISLAHGIPAVFMASYAIINIQNSLRTLASPNTIFQKVVLEYSIAYFLMDLLHYIIFLPRDFLFIIHHVATLYVLLTCRYIVHNGAFEILVLLILAEATSACQNVWSLASFQKADVPAAAKLYDFLSVHFYAAYSVVRGIMGPLFVYKMGEFYFSGEADNLIPKWARVSWMIVVMTGISLSILWVLNNWISWYRELTCRSGKKVS